MRLLLPALPLVYNNGTDLEARSATLLAAYYGGACIAASGTTAVHALSYPLGGTYRVPHGVSNAALLVPVMSYQKKKIAPRLAEAARAIGLVPAGSGSSAEEEADLLIKSLDNLVKELRFRQSQDLGFPTAPCLPHRSGLRRSKAPGQQIRGTKPVKITGYLQVGK